MSGENGKRGFFRTAIDLLKGKDDSTVERVKTLEADFRSFLEKCYSETGGIADHPDLLVDLFSRVGLTAHNVIEENKDYNPTVRFGDHEKPCWKVGLLVPVDEMNSKKRVIALIHADTPEEASEMAYSMTRRHLKEAMRLTKVDKIEPYNPEPVFDDGYDDIEDDIDDVGNFGEDLRA